MTTNNHYIFNLETTKIELHFEKADYGALTDAQKRELKSAFLWSNRGKCWVSRAKEPNLWRAKDVAKKLGFTAEVREGERIAYGEQLQRQTERAEARAERLEGYAGNAEKRAEQLQKPLASMRGDISFFTQPIISGHSGSQAFARRREKMYAAYHKGFDEFRKSDYFKDRAQTARETASQAQFDDPAYLDRRIKECKKTIRDREKNIIYYEEILHAIESGAEKKWHGGEVVTVESVTEHIERELELVAVTMDKQGYLESCLEELGGIRFHKGNIEVGYIVSLRHYERVEVVSTGPVNIWYLILDGGAKGMTLQATYAEIRDIVDTSGSKKKRETHPFKVGDTFKVKKRTYPDNTMRCVVTETDYEIVKASDTTIQLRPVGADTKPICRKPRKCYNGDWRFSVDETWGNSFYKTPEVSA
jgi:hypothetical protein